MAAGAVPVTYVPSGGDFIETGDVGGSRFGFWTPRAFNPSGMVGVTTTTQVATLSVPPTFSTMSGGQPYSTGATQASGSPWSTKASPLPWLIGLLVLAMLLSHHLYFKRR